MKKKTLSPIIILATISIAGAIALQFFFLHNTYIYSEKQFKESVSIALKEVAWQILSKSNNISFFDSLTPVKIISNNYYFVKTNRSIIDYELLKYHLSEEFKRHQIFIDYEFAINNPISGKLEEKTFISKNDERSISLYNFPSTLHKNTNYFAVHFPNRTPYFRSHLTIWALFSVLLIIIIFFFGYTLSIIIKQRQLSQTQKNFINNLTHELKTPISSISLSTQILSDKQILNNPQRLFKYIKIIENQNIRLKNNVEKVLNVASLEKNKITLNREKININLFLKETINIFKSTKLGNNSLLSLSSSEEQIFIKADKFHLTNLLLNLLENSAKYCKKQPHIDIEYLINKKKLLIKIYDNGIGIPSGHRKKIFNPFYRIPTGNIHDVKGFGLGLNYVHKIIKAHRWKIKVDKNLKEGTIFTILIPHKAWIKQ